MMNRNDLPTTYGASRNFRFGPLKRNSILVSECHGYTPSHSTVPTTFLVEDSFGLPKPSGESASTLNRVDPHSSVALSRTALPRLCHFFAQTALGWLHGPSACWDWQHPDPPEHRPDESSRQLTLRQQERPVADVLHEASPSLDRGAAAGWSLSRASPSVDVLSVNRTYQFCLGSRVSNLR